MPVKARVIGVKRLQARLASIAKEATDEVQKAVADGARLVQGDAIRRIQKGPASGRTYGNHQASAPGEAPATDTGRLASSVHVDIGNHEAFVKVSAKYGAPLEFGTRKMEPRPFLRPAVMAKIDQITKAIRAALRKGVTDSGRSDPG